MVSSPGSQDIKSTKEDKMPDLHARPPDLHQPRQCCLCFEYTSWSEKHNLMNMQRICTSCN